MAGAQDQRPASRPDSGPIRDAATVVVLRNGTDGPQVLMGQRGAAAAFMPSKYVFPGGGVDPSDHLAPRLGLLGPRCRQRLMAMPLTQEPGLGVAPSAQFAPSAPSDPDALATAALRELAEETGLHLVLDDSAPALRFIFRAITPPGRSRRFDARFFLVDAARIAGNPDDFAAASDELSHLHWIGTDAARALDLPFITEVVLAELSASLSGAPDAGVPFFDNSGHRPAFRRLHAR